MTLNEISFQLQKPLTAEQTRRLGEFANVYGLRRFRVDPAGTRLTFEYDASRLKPTEVTSVLRRARIPAMERAPEAA